MLKINRLGINKTSLSVIVFSLFLVACGDKKQDGPPAMQVPVSVIQVKPTAAEINVELPGRVEAIKDAEIRARVTGIVNEINFVQGSEVTEDQLLFTIDPAPYQAARDAAAARLQQAQADVKAADALAARYSKLIKSNAVSRQEYDNAIAQSNQGKAAVAAAQAALQSAEIDLGYTKVVSPISGRIGKSFVTEGALVNATQASLMASVQQLDNVYVDITRSTAEIAKIRQAIQNGDLKQNDSGNLSVTVIMDDGSNYEQKGELLFSGVSVDPSTGQVSLRAKVSNPDEILLPGMYVRVQLQQGVDDQALMVPNQAIQRGADGLNTLMIVEDGKVGAVAVRLGSQINGQTIVTSGLKEDATVIVEGFQKIRPGAPVQAIPWSKDQTNNDDNPDK